MGTERRWSDRDEVREAVACPKCRAVPGWPCVGARGRIRVSNHQARVDQHDPGRREPCALLDRDDAAADVDHREPEKIRW